MTKYDTEQRSWIKRLGQAFFGEPQTLEHIIEILRNANERGLLDADALSMIEAVFQVAEMQVKNIMVPRSQMVVVNEDSNAQEMLPTIIKSAHSRFPVIGTNRDEVIGILLAKDVLRYFAEEQKQDFDIRDVLRPAIFIPETKRLNTLLNEFKSSRNHMAIVVDEYGGVAGLITIEDVLEQIVGDITDEHDDEEGQYILQHDNNNYTIKALTPIEDINEQFGTEYSDDEYETFGGLVLSHFGHLPKQGEKIKFDRFAIEVLKADRRRLHLLSAKYTANSP